MKIFKRHLIFFVLSAQMFADQMNVLPPGFLGRMSPEKKTKNNITGSVQSNAARDQDDEKSSASTRITTSRPSSSVLSIPGSTTSSQGVVDSLSAKPKVQESADDDDVKRSQSSSTVDNILQAVKEKSDDSKDDSDESDHPMKKAIKQTAKQSDEPSEPKAAPSSDAKEEQQKNNNQSEPDKPKEDQKPTIEKGVLYQDPGFIDDNELVSFNFEETDLSNVASYMEKIHNVKFVPEDIITPNTTAKNAKGGDLKGLAGHKLTFRTNKVLTKKESWNLFLTFLHIAGLDVVPMLQAGFYKIVPFVKANSEAIPTYIGVDPQVLPDNDMIIRYVYFARNVDPTKVQPILTKMQAGSAKLDVFSELKALIFTDRASNIKSLMQIVGELDKAVLPESLSVLRLKKANVEDVITLYKSLKPSGASAGTQPVRAWAPGKKDPSLDYFPQDVSTFADKRTNSLILLGPEKGIKKIEGFVEKYVDVDASKDAPPLFTYQLQYTNATDIQALLTKVVQYGSNTSAGQVGGVREGIKYFSKMNIVAETHSNSLIINSTKEDYEALLPLIKELDIPQKQIGLEVLIVQVNDSEAKVLGSQISGPGGPNAAVDANKGCQTFARTVSAQSSGILNVAGQGTSPVVTTPGNNETYSIKSSLSKLLGAPSSGTSVVNEAGSILLTFGKPIWAIFKILKSMVSTHVVSNPFVVVSNNSPANISIGEQRRIISGQTVSQNGTVNSFQNQESTLGFTITPQINKNNIVNLNINIKNDQFSVQGSETSGSMDKKSIQTYASVANGEVLVLGGIMQESYASTHRGVPFLEHIPIFGWLFKSKTKSLVKNHFLIFISPRLLDPIDKKKGLDRYTRYKMEEADRNIEMMDDLDWFASRRDPVQKWFFGDSKSKNLKQLAGKDQQSKLLKKRQEENSKKHKKQVEKKQKKEHKQKNKKSKKQQSSIAEPVSFENDFMMHNKAAPEAKNTITKSMQQGGVA